jgi:phosphoglycolate phosphatase-like HAD superfamily hydrolase
VINAIICDLDGTLVQSGKITAQSYAIAAQRMRGLAEPEPRAIEAYRKIVGSAGEAATRHVIENWPRIRGV